MSVLFGIYINPKDNRGILIWSGYVKGIDDNRNTINIYFRYDPKNFKVDIEKFNITQLLHTTIGSTDELDEYFENIIKRKFYLTLIKNYSDYLNIKQIFFPKSHNIYNSEDDIIVNKDKVNIKLIYNRDDISLFDLNDIDDKYKKLRIYFVKDKKVNKETISRLLKLINDNIVNFSKLKKLYENIVKDNNELFLIRFTGSGEIFGEKETDDMKLRVYNDIDVISDNVNTGLNLIRYMIISDKKSKSIITNYDFKYSYNEIYFTLKANLIINPSSKDYIIIPNEISIYNEKSGLSIKIGEYNKDKSKLVINNQIYEDIFKYISERMENMINKINNSILKTKGVNNIVEKLIDIYKIVSGNKLLNINEILRIITDLINPFADNYIINTLNNIFKSRNFENNLEINVKSISKYKKELYNQVIDNYKKIIKQYINSKC